MNSPIEALRKINVAEARRRARQSRLHNWTWKQRKALAARFSERFGIAPAAGNRRGLRNARKRERQGR